MLFRGSSKILTWRQFARHVRSKGGSLLARLDEFPDSVLVTGCQRSGTTMVARIIFQSEGMVNYWTGKDDELDAALILSGKKDHNIQAGRYCFQTTYLNENYQEYFEHQGRFRLIWVLRNPYSVVNSMLFNWSRFALDELFDACGSQLLEGRDLIRYNKYGRYVINRAKRACLAYQGKTQQAFELKERLGDEMLVVDYDDLVSDSIRVLREVYTFIDLPFKKEYGKSISRRSIRKACKLPGKIRSMIEDMALPEYERARVLLEKSGVGN